MEVIPINKHSVLNKKSILISALLLPFFAISQGIHFEKINFEEALSKAEKEGKLVFVDFYTVWCGPCKKMDKDVFVLPEVGQVYNNAFVNIKLDAEKEGATVAKTYKVSGFPTFLYLKPDGAVVFKDTGSMPVEYFIKNGQKAIASVDSDYSLENLQQAFQNKKNDEQFLKMYVEKMKEYGQIPIEGVEAWLNVQTEMDEAGPEMMNYILNNTDLFLLNGKADAILNQNYETYMQQASTYEQKRLSRAKSQIVKNTKVTALRKNDAALMKTYIDVLKQLPEELAGNDVIINDQLAYYALLKDDEAYKALTQKYVDSLINSKTMVEIKEKDEAFYQRYKKTYDSNPNEKTKIMLDYAQTGIEATKILKNLASKGQGYLSRTTSKTEYKTLSKWIAYGYKLKPENCFMDDLKAEMLYKKGKTKKAIQLKERAIKNWPQNDKKFVNKQYELEQMKALFYGKT
ncbi:MAG: thioredoxin family protein [Flavobacteriaceae bacterium]